MFKKRVVVIATVLIATLLFASSVLASTIDPVSRTITTSQYYVDFDDANPEEIVDLRWNGSPNLTNSAVVAGCADALEYFGNSWVTQDEGTPSFVFASLVGWGTTGTWNNKGSSNIDVHSSSSGCPGSLNVPVRTKYKFFDHGPVANRIQVHRTFSFGSTPLTYNLRAYIPRMYPSSDYSQVLHPDASGTSLLTETSAACPFGCRVDDWDGSWFAIHSPTTGTGLIVRRGSSSVGAALWVDEDSASSTNASNILLLSPAGGFTGNVSEVEFMCIYDSSIWSPSLSLPPGC
jgi:hypothetical protein